MTRKTLTKQEKKFVEIKAETGNGTLAAKEAFGIEDPNYAGVKAHDLLRNPKIVNALEEALPDDLLAKVHKEGLSATREDEPDYAVRHKYLDSAYKLKGSYAPEKHTTLSLQISREERDKILGISIKVREEMTHAEING
jgi:phage terminase small subunit